MKFSAFASVATASLIIATRFTVERRRTSADIAQAQARRDELQRQVDELTDAKRQAELDERVIWSLLRQCRTADDIPQFGGERVVMHHQGHEKLCLYVPRGAHTLQISCDWKPSPGANDQEADVESEVDEAAGEKTWDVPLLPESGYWLAFTVPKDGKPIRWELSANNPDFETCSNEIGLGGLSSNSSSHTGESQGIWFPNQIMGLYRTKDLQAAAKSPPGLRLMSAKVFGNRDQCQWVVDITVRLLSDGPACVPADQFPSALALGGDDVLMSYDGGGKYELRRNGDQDAPTD